MEKSTTAKAPGAKKDSKGYYYKIIESGWERWKMSQIQMNVSKRKTDGKDYNYNSVAPNSKRQKKIKDAKTTIAKLHTKRL